MKRVVLVLSVVVGAWMFSPTPEAQAWDWSGSKQGRQSKGGKHRAAKHHKAKHHKGKSATGKSVIGGATVPELDPGAAGSAIVLLLGGTAWIASRRRDEELV